MNDQARQALGELIARYGPGLVDDPRQCEALLRDYLGAHKRELNALVGALRDGIPAELQRTPGSVPMEVRLATLSQRLANDQALDPAAARWAVDAWAAALGVTAAPPLPAPPEAVAQYRGALQFAADKPVDTALVQRLQRLADELRLTPEQAAAAERTVLGDTKEALLRTQSTAPPPAAPEAKLPAKPEPLPVAALTPPPAAAPAPPSVIPPAPPPVVITQAPPHARTPVWLWALAVAVASIVVVSMWAAVNSYAWSDWSRFYTALLPFLSPPLLVIGLLIIAGMDRQRWTTLTVAASLLGELIAFGLTRNYADEYDYGFFGSDFNFHPVASQLLMLAPLTLLLGLPLMWAFRRAWWWIFGVVGSLMLVISELGYDMDNWLLVATLATIVLVFVWVSYLDRRDNPATSLRTGDLSPPLLIIFAAIALFLIISVFLLSGGATTPLKATATAVPAPPTNTVAAIMPPQAALTTRGPAATITTIAAVPVREALPAGGPEATSTIAAAAPLPAVLTISSAGVMNTAATKAVLMLTSHPRWVRCAFASDGQMRASAHPHGLRVLVLSVAFAPDGQTSPLGRAMRQCGCGGSTNRFWRNSGSGD
jgi:hypothetical protein